jgi:beta-lactamase superfamily II metal-dependent hydrolase
MWLSGDAERPEQAFFELAYAANPGLDVRVLKGNHHGSCNGVSARWLQLTTPEWTTFGVSSTNTFGHVHEQAKTLDRVASARWLRTDENGRITFRTRGTPGSDYSVSLEREGVSLNGRGDRIVAESSCG